MVLTLVAAAIFWGVAGLAWLAVQQLRDASRMMVEDTLPGLMDAGTAAERMHDNRFAMRQMLMSQSKDERAKSIYRVQTNNTDALWSDYAASIYQAEDRQDFQALLAAHKDYRDGCQRFFDMMLAEKDEEASAFFYGELSVLFQRYDGAAKALFNYNVRQATERSKEIRRTARFTPLAVAGLTVLGFLFGLILGMRHAFSGMVMSGHAPPRV